MHLVYAAFISLSIPWQFEMWMKLTITTNLLGIVRKNRIGRMVGKYTSYKGEREKFEKFVEWR